MAFYLKTDMYPYCLLGGSSGLCSLHLRHVHIKVSVCNVTNPILGPERHPGGAALLTGPPAITYGAGLGLILSLLLLLLLLLV